MLKFHLVKIYVQTKFPALRYDGQMSSSAVTHAKTTLSYAQYICMRESRCSFVLFVFLGKEIYCQEEKSP